MTTFNPREHFKTTLMMFTVLLSGMFLFAMVALYLTYGKADPIPYPEHYFTITVLLAIVALILGPFIARKMIDKVLALSFEKKMNTYRTTTLIKLSLLEAVALLSIVFYLTTVDLKFLIIAGVMAVIFRYHRPTPMRIAKQMQLKKDEAMQLTNIMH